MYKLFRSSLVVHFEVAWPRNYTLNYGLEWDEPWGQANLPVRDEVKGFNRIVAGIRLRQERADGSWESCKVPQAVAPEKVKAWLGKPCMPADPSYDARHETAVEKAADLLRMSHRVLRELVGVIRSAKYGIYQAVFHDYLNFWNAVDWVSIICAYAVIGTYVRLISETGSTTGTMGRYILEDQNALTTYQSEVWSERVFASVQSVVLAEADFRFTLMFYPIVVVVRLLKSFDAQPRLAVVTKTIYNAWKDLLHFFIVFFCVYFCLGVNSVLVFGQDMESFATLDRGLMSSFRAMFGDWDWPQMQTIGIGRIAAATWMWLFLVVVVVLLLNMMLAILLDSYSAVKSQTSSLATLNTQISEMLRRRRQSANGERVGLAELWKAYLDKFGDERQMLQSTEMVTAEEIMQQVEGIKESQAKRTLGNAKKSWEKSQEAPYTPQIYMEQLKLCGVRLRLLRGKTGEMRKAFGVADHQHLAEAVAHQETTNIVMRTVREPLD
eukprot:g15913.t1